MFADSGRVLHLDRHLLTDSSEHIDEGVEAELVDLPAQEVVETGLRDAEALRRLALRELGCPDIALNLDHAPEAHAMALRFCLHKLALFSLRPGADNPKRQKDALQGAMLAAALARDQDFLLSEAIDGMDKAFRKRVKPGAKRALESVGTQFPEAASVLELLT